MKLFSFDAPVDILRFLISFIILSLPFFFSFLTYTTVIGCLDYQAHDFTNIPFPLARIDSILDASSYLHVLLLLVDLFIFSCSRLELAQPEQGCRRFSPSLSRLVSLRHCPSVAMVLYIDALAPLGLCTVVMNRLARQIERGCSVELHSWYPV